MTWKQGGIIDGILSSILRQCWSVLWRSPGLVNYHLARASVSELGEWAVQGDTLSQGSQSPPPLWESATPGSLHVHCAFDLFLFYTGYSSLDGPHSLFSQSSFTHAPGIPCRAGRISAILRAFHPAAVPQGRLRLLSVRSGHLSSSSWSVVSLPPSFIYPLRLCHSDYLIWETYTSDFCLSGIFCFDSRPQICSQWLWFSSLTDCCTFLMHPGAGQRRI